METRNLTDRPEAAAEIIKKGGLVAVPTETVYGLACSGFNEKAVRELYRVKGRPAVKPLSLLVPGPEALERYGREIPAGARALAERFWPGPLTIIVKARPEIPEIIRAGGESVGLRCPDQEQTLKLLKLAGLPLAAPSANPSGSPSPKNLEEVLAYFDGQIDAVIDGGPCGLGRESTVFDMSRMPYRVLRQGALPEEAVAGALTDALTVIGITGGTGCGKTTALEELKALGALTLDCDAVYHELLENGALANRILRRFPQAERNGRLDLKALGELAFSDPAALAELNALTHGEVVREVERRLKEWAMAGGTLAAVDAVELLGSGLESRCRAVIGILAGEEARVRRVMARDGLTEAYARLRVRAQKPDSYYEARCTHVLRNDSDRDAFIKNFHRIISEVWHNG